MRVADAGVDALEGKENVAMRRDDGAALEWSGRRNAYQGFGFFGAGGIFSASLGFSMRKST